MPFDYEEYKQQERAYCKKNAYLFTELNAHPDDKNVRDCVKRAITSATGMNYNDVKIELNRHKKVTNTKKFNERKNWVSYVEKVLGLKRLKGFQNMKIGEFAKTNPTGTYIIKCRKHLTCVMNGKVMDTWNPSFKAINRVWVVK
jgi:hypothetical protein